MKINVERVCLSYVSGELHWDRFWQHCLWTVFPTLGWGKQRGLYGRSYRRVCWNQDWSLQLPESKFSLNL